VRVLPCLVFVLTSSPPPLSFFIPLAAATPRAAPGIAARATLPAALPTFLPTLPTQERLFKYKLFVSRDRYSY